MKKKIEQFKSLAKIAKATMGAGLVTTVATPEDPFAGLLITLVGIVADAVISYIKGKANEKAIAEAEKAQAIE